VSSEAVVHTVSATHLFPPASLLLPQYVVNCGSADGMGPALPGHPDVAYVELNSDDTCHEGEGRTDPRAQWPAIMELMHRARRTAGGGNVFIHCLQGAWVGLG
jgi:hypothetical protein